MNVPTYDWYDCAAAVSSSKARATTPFSSFRASTIGLMAASTAGLAMVNGSPPAAFVAAWKLAECSLCWLWKSLAASAMAAVFTRPESMAVW